MAKKTEYDPNLKYGWNKETKFEMDGNEFGTILNTFRTVLATPEAQKILLLNQASVTAEAILKRNVEAGKVKPAESQPAPMEVAE